MRPLQPAFCALLTGATLLITPSSAPGSPGDLDTSFQNTGWKAYAADINGFRDMVLQPDGKVVVTGRAVQGPDDYWGALAVWRFLPDGTSDVSFNGTGRHLFLAGELSGAIGEQVAVRPDGKIVVSGGVGDQIFGVMRSVVARLLPNGQRDTSFGSNGEGWTIGGPDGWGVAMAIGNDGSILVSGSSGNVERYGENGRLAATFGPNNGPPIGSLAVQSDNKIVYVQEDAVRRLHPNGAVDANFGTAGAVSFQNSLPGGEMRVSRVMVLAGGKIVAAGFFKDAGGNGGMFVARLLSNGTPDPAFGDGTHGPGLAFNSFGQGVEPAVFALRIQPDGHIVAGGMAIDLASGHHDIALARFTADGLTDVIFGTGGRVRMDLGSNSESCFSIAFPSDRKLLVAGIYKREVPPQGGTLADGLLARYSAATTAVSLAVEYAGGVEMPAGAGAMLDFGLVTAGTSIREIVLRNDGVVPLTGFSVNLTGESHAGEFLTGPVPATLAPGATVRLAIQLTPSAAPGARTATLHLASDIQGLTPFAIALSGSKATPQQVWRVTWFGSPDNSGPGADVNDFDGDGVVNFMEYATGGNPHQASPMPGAVEKNGAETAFTYSRPAAATGELLYQPEAAADPAGPWSAAGLVSAVQSETGGVQTVKVTVEGGTPAARLFFRLRVTRQ